MVPPVVPKGNAVKKKKPRSKRFQDCVSKLMPRAPLGSLPPPIPPHEARLGVERALEEFKDLLRRSDNKSGMGPAEVCKAMMDDSTSFSVNQEYAMRGASGGQFGHVPGVDIGKSFGYRAELSLVGLHRPLQKGIDSKDVIDKDGRPESLAISIVFSPSKYEDDVDRGETLIYTGEGGQENGGQRQTEDQKKERGNQALINSKFSKNHIRVIKTREDASGRSKSVVYYYDGLYKVVHYVKKRGKSGFKVFLFTLVREKDQADHVPR